jgi:hypothetical protein
MKKTLLFGCLALSVQAFAQTTIFSENFNDVDSEWELNTEGFFMNQFIIDGSYNGNGPNSIPNTPNQPAGITDSPDSRYLHITNYGDCFGFVLVSCNAHFNPSDSSNNYAQMTDDFSTTGFTDVTLSFWYLSGGEENEAYGGVEYSVNGGTSWVDMDTNLVNTTAWTQVTLTDPAFDNQSDLRFRFHWINGTSGLGMNPSLAIDDIKVSGMEDDASIEENAVTSINVYPNPASDIIHVTAGSNVSKAELLDQSGRVIRTVEVNNTKFDLNISDLNQGVYFVRINGNTTSRFTKR